MKTLTRKNYPANTVEFNAKAQDEDGSQRSEIRNALNNNPLTRLRSKMPSKRSQSLRLRVNSLLT